MVNTSRTLFGQLAEIRANVKRARADVTRLRALIRGRASVGGERTSAEDMRIQLRQALGLFDYLLRELTPIAEFHDDQPIRSAAREKRSQKVPRGRKPQWDSKARRTAHG